MIIPVPRKGIADAVSPVTEALPESKLRRNMTAPIGNTPSKGADGRGSGPAPTPKGAMTGSGSRGMPKGAMASREGAGARGKGYMGCK